MRKLQTGGGTQMQSLERALVVQRRPSFAQVDRVFLRQRDMPRNKLSNNLATQLVGTFKEKQTNGSNS